MRNSTLLLMLTMGLLALGTASCVRMTHQLEQTRPLEINVNVRLQIDRELDEFFAYQNRTPGTNGPAAPAPAAPPVTQVPPAQPAQQ